MRKHRNFIYIFLSCIVVFTVQCKFEMCVGAFEESKLLNGLNKMIVAFNAPDFADLLTLAAVMVMFRAVAQRAPRFDVGTGIFSLLLAALLVTCISFKKFNSTVFLFDNIFQVMLSLFCIAGFSILIYLVLRLFFYVMERDWTFGRESDREGFYEKHFFKLGAVVMLLGWLVWILLNYPGTSCGDSISQLKQFMGEMEWGAAHPPLSSAIMGVLFTLGRSLINANFGYFL